VQGWSGGGRAVLPLTWPQSSTIPTFSKIRTKKMTSRSSRISTRRLGAHSMHTFARLCHVGIWLYSETRPTLASLTSSGSVVPVFPSVLRSQMRNGRTKRRNSFAVSPLSVTRATLGAASSSFNTVRLFVDFYTRDEPLTAFIGWADTDTFPPKPTSNPRLKQVSGLDPIIGQKNVDPAALALDPTKDDHADIGSFPGEETTPLTIPREFVVSRGGEYFFSPSLDALRSNKFSLPPPFVPDHPRACT